MKKNVSDLKFHPKNAFIYGAAESVADLKEKIRKSGRVTTITINSDNVIISGNRRVKACRELVAEGDNRFEELECEVKEFDSEEDELEYLVICNDMRDKTVEQKAREAKTLMEIERIRAAKRRKATQNNNAAKEIQGKAECPTLDTQSGDKTGRATDIAAEKVGMKSGQEVSRSIAAVNKIDELEEQGKTSDAELIRNELNHGSASAAEKLAKNIDTLSNEDKQNIRDKKISVNKAVNKEDKPVKKLVDKPVSKSDEIPERPETRAEFLQYLGLQETPEEKMGISIKAPDTHTITLNANPENAEYITDTFSHIAKWMVYLLRHNNVLLADLVERSLDDGHIDIITTMEFNCENMSKFLTLFTSIHSAKAMAENQKKLDHKNKAKEEEAKAAAEARAKAVRAEQIKFQKMSMKIHEAGQVGD